MKGAIALCKGSCVHPARQHRGIFEALGTHRSNQSDKSLRVDSTHLSYHQIKWCTCKNSGHFKLSNKYYLRKKTFSHPYKGENNSQHLIWLLGVNTLTEQLHVDQSAYNCGMCSCYSQHSIILVVLHHDINTISMPIRLTAASTEIHLPSAKKIAVTQHVNETVYTN